MGLLPVDPYGTCTVPLAHVLQVKRSSLAMVPPGHEVHWAPTAICADPHTRVALTHVALGAKLLQGTCTVPTGHETHAVRSLFAT